MSKPKVALVTDWLTHWGGAELVFAKLMAMYPDAPIYTSVFFPTRPEVFAGREIHTSFIQHIPLLNRRHKLCMLLRPLAFRFFNFNQYDLVISSSSAEAKGIRVKSKKGKVKRLSQLPPGQGHRLRGLSPLRSDSRRGMPEGQGGLMQLNGNMSSGTVHICYCHTPTRYLWSHTREYRKNLEFGGLNWLAKLVIPSAFKIMRRWDFRAAQRPDIMIANSITTQERIRQYYKRESIVVYPFYKIQNEGGNSKLKPELPLTSEVRASEGGRGVIVGNFKLNNSVDQNMNAETKEASYFVCLGRIVPYKRYDLAILACNFLGKNLKIFTSTRNSESERLQKLSGPTIEWIFHATDDEVRTALEGASGFLMPQEEDFGIVALEAMSAGIPVIAYGEGGATETVIHGKTGLLFSEQTVESLVNAIQKSADIECSRDAIRARSEEFSEERFEGEARRIIEEVISDGL